MFKVGEYGSKEAEEDKLDGGDQPSEDDRVRSGSSLFKEAFAVDGVNNRGHHGEDVADDPPCFEGIDLFTGEGATDCEDDAENDEHGSYVMSSPIGRAEH